MKLTTCLDTSRLLRSWFALSVLIWHVALGQDAAGIPYRMISQGELEAARKVAKELLAKIDVAPSSAFLLNELYRPAGLALSTRYTAPEFAGRLASVRAPLGAVRERKFSGFHGPYHSLPNVISGDYLIIVFVTRFKGRQGAFTEQITLEADRLQAPTWRLVEYYVAPR
jgi:Protein of unknown function (DUF4019)